MNLFLILLSGLTVASVNGFDYCADGICPPGVKHIACNNDNQFSSNCASDVSLADMTESVKTAILIAHNKRRDAVAKGEIAGFESVSRMPTMLWNDELASFAEMSVKRCTFAHDECRNTERYKQTGQNMAYLSDWGQYGNVEDTIEKFFKMWFQEYKQADMTYISSYHENQAVSHFTQMVSDRINNVGCALSRYTDKWNTNLKTSLLVCNYSFATVYNEPVYQSGNAAERCRTGANQQWNGLCSPEESVTPYASGKYGNW